MESKSALERAAGEIASARRVMVFSGAGMSADSGIATFRSQGTGVWNGIKGKFALAYFGTPIGWKLTPGWGWSSYIREFYGPIARAQPNAGHVALARLQKEIFGEQMKIVTMNVDGLHQAAGSTEVYEVHGTVRRHRCIKNGHPMDVNIDPDNPGPAPLCPMMDCGSSARPDCVLFTEGLPGDQWIPAVRNTQSLQRGDVVIVVGTSSVVYPAASLPEMASQQGATIIEFNLVPSALTPLANIFVEGKAGETLPLMVERVVALRKGAGDMFNPQ